MRTILTLDPDVAALLKRVRKARGTTLKEAVNEALRRGLKQMTEPTPEAGPRRTEAVPLGRCLIVDLDDIADALTVAEDKAFR
jgi:hypothetical protein